MAVRRLALLLEYEGTRYSGFQYQKNAPSVQREVESAIQRLTGEQVRIAGAGRTDAGVHAAGQVVAFTTEAPYECRSFASALNHFLPEDIAVRQAREVPLGFDPRRHARSRVYRYTVLNREGRSALWRRFAHTVYGLLDAEAMRVALAMLEGQRDFAPFAGPLGGRRSTVRRLYRTAVWREGEVVRLEVEGNAFLPQQVRRMAAAVLRVGTRQMSMEEFGALANGGRHGACQWMLPPAGLCLVSVNYPGLFFEET
ncbi:MAG: tRNA pseudouridine(38-40) synthase TruA [Chloroflexi bacterium]|nr:tRNA pseudouridine(38-40) synthase TruA [Chloroflexota bacterium]